MPPATRTRKAATTPRRKPVVITPEGELVADADDADADDVDADVDVDDAPRARTTPRRVPQRLRDEAALDSREDDPDVDDFDIEDAEVPDTLVFTSDYAAQEKRENDPGTVFEFDGRRFRAFKPKDTVMVTLIAANSSSATVADQVDAVLKWLDHCLEPVAKMHLQSRMYDRDDPIEWDDLASVMLALLEHWQGGNREDRRSVAREKARLRRQQDEGNAAAGRRGVVTRPRRE